MLEQATDPRRFYPDPRPDLSHELVFVGNSRNVRRKILDDLLPTSHELAVYGSNWDGLIDSRYLAGEYLPNDELRRTYSSASIVLNDHWPDMRANGYISNRVYDAVACGAVVVSDDVDGLSERFGDAVVSYQNRDELHHALERLIADPADLRRRGQEGRRRVLAEHTFAHRVDRLLTLVAERTEALGYRSTVEPASELAADGLGTQA